MGLFCLSRHLWLLFRSQSRSGGVERVRCDATMSCVHMCVVHRVPVLCHVSDVLNDFVARLPY